MKIIIGLKCGYGNQLFSYAFGYALSKELKCKLCLDTTLYDCGIEELRELELLQLNIVYDSLINTEYNKNFVIRKLGINKIKQMIRHGFFTKTFVEKKKNEYDSDVFKIKTSTYFNGYWHNYQYFDKYYDDFIELFTPKNERCANVKNLEKEMYSENSVSVHIRRGDYVMLGWELPFYYYEQAMKKISKELERVRFYIFSDDMIYARENIKETENVCFVEYSSDNRTIDDLYLMSKCKHNIVSNSTYSWWGAYLNQNKEKKIIAPVVYPLWKKNRYPESWDKIDVDIKKN